MTIRRAHIVLVSTDSYVVGAIALRLALLLMRCKPSIKALVTDDVSPTALDALRFFRIDAIRGRDSYYSADCADHYWRFTLCRLEIFSLDNFDKIVYIDSDMFVLSNLDELFTRPHMSAVGLMRLPDGEEWNGLNSGLMVISPNKELEKQLTDCILAVAGSASRFGDQDIIQFCIKDRPNATELQLDEGYNVYIGAVDHYVRCLDYSFVGAGKAIHCVHFIGPRKPWQSGFAEQLKLVAKLARKRELRRLALTVTYLSATNLIRLVLSARARWRATT